MRLIRLALFPGKGRSFHLTIIGRALTMVAVFLLLLPFMEAVDFIGHVLLFGSAVICLCAGIGLERRHQLGFVAYFLLTSLMAAYLLSQVDGYHGALLLILVGMLGVVFSRRNEP